MSLEQHIPSNRQRCPICGQNLAMREIMLYTSLFNALGRVYAMIRRRGSGYRFEMRDIRHLLGRNEYCRFGDLALSGGLVFKEEKAKSRRLGKCWIPRGFIRRDMSAVGKWI